jgi:tagatose-1,6-bisphosphate aldolase non-catalytic subunit AgaZ/GatZ
LTATTLQNSRWVLKKKAVLAYALDLNVSCLAHLHIVHDQTANQGSISLSITADLAPTAVTQSQLKYVLSVQVWPSGHATDPEDAIAFTEMHNINCMVEEFPL